MKNTSMRRIVSLTVVLALLVTFIPFISSNNYGLADDASPISARVNGYTQTDGKNLQDILDKSGIKDSATITRIEVISGVITQADFAAIAKTGQIAGLTQLNMKTAQPPPTITDATIFQNAPVNRTIHVRPEMLAAYKAVADDDATDNAWYGFSLIEDSASATPAPPSANQLTAPKVVVAAPKVGDVPSVISKQNATDNFTIGSTFWTDITDPTKPQNAVKFEDGKVYKATVSLTAADTYWFKVDAKPTITDSTVYKTKQAAPVLAPTNVSVTSPDAAKVNNTMTFDIVFGKAAAGAPRAITGVLDVTMRAPAPSDTAPVPSAPAGSKFKVVATWSSVPAMSNSKFPADPDSFAAIVTVTATAPEDFNPASLPTLNPALIASHTDYDTVISTATLSNAGGATNDTATFNITYTRKIKAINPIKIAINYPTPGDDVKVASVSAGEKQFAITSTVWSMNNAALPLGQVFSSDTSNVYSVVVTATETAPAFFPDTANAKVELSHSGLTAPGYNVKSVTALGVANGVLSFNVNFEKASPANCPHPADQLEIIGPRVDGKDTVEANWGQNVTFKIIGVTCHACGTAPNVTYSWNKTHKIDGTGTPIIGEDKAEMTLKSVADKDSDYLYFVTILTDKGSTKDSEKVSLKVYDRRKPILSFVDENGWTGEFEGNTSVTVLVETNPETTNLTFEWTKEGDTKILGRAATLDLTKLQFEDAGWYIVKVLNKDTAMSETARIYLTITQDPNNLFPITVEDIFALEFKAPVTGETPAYIKAPAGAKYNITHAWRVGSSPIDSSGKYLAGKSYVTDVKIKTNLGHKFVPDANGEMRVTVLNSAAQITKIEYTNLNVANGEIRMTIKFPTTGNPNKQDQSQLQFANTMPQKRNYGDPDFAISTQGGSGDGKITYTTSDDKVFEIVPDGYGNAVVRIVGGGSATITATKAAGKDEFNNYNPAIATSGTITIAPKTLVVKASDKTIKVGSKTELFPVEISGFVKGDTQYTLNGFEAPVAAAVLPVVDTTTKTSSKAKDKLTPEQVAAAEKAALDKQLGKYDIIVKGGKPTAAYVFRYVHGTLTISETGIDTTPNTEQNFLKTNSYMLEDRRNGISITGISQSTIFEAGTELLVENRTYALTPESRALYNANINAFASGKELAQLYDITIKVDGTPVQPVGEVMVDIDLSNSLKGRYGNLEIAYINDNGDITIMPYAVNAEKISFLTNHFSHYAIIGVPRNVNDAIGGNNGAGSGGNVPQTSDANPYLPMMIMLGALSLATIIKLRFDEKSHN